MYLIPVHGISIRVTAQRPNLSHLMQKILSDKTNADGEQRRSVLVQVSAARCEVPLSLRSHWICRNKRNMSGLFLPECRQRCCVFSGSRSPGSHGFSSQCSGRPERGAVERRGAVTGCPEMQPVCSQPPSWSHGGCKQRHATTSFKYTVYVMIYII